MPRPFPLLDDSVFTSSGYKRSTKRVGPDLDDACLCGSRRRTRSCHATAAGRWIASEPPPLLNDARTGYAHPECFGQAGADCSDKISREHWISANIHRQLHIDGKAPMLSGAPWLHGASKSVGTKALASKILCERHNNALSPLDSIAGQFFQAVRDMQLSLASTTAPFLGPADDHFLLLSGPRLQLWLLKLVLGGVASRSFGAAGTPLKSVRTQPGVALHDILWRGALFPNRWGLHARRHRVDPKGTPESIGVINHTIEDEVCGATVQFGALNLNLGLGVPENSATVQPASYRFDRPSTNVQKYIALAWPEDGHEPISYSNLG